MAKIQRAVLKQLEAFYRFVGGQDGAPVDFELGLGIASVHDVSREVEQQDANQRQDMGAGGYWVASVLQNHLVVGDINESLNFVSPVNASNGYTLDEGTEWVWITAVWGTVDDNSDLAAASVLINNFSNDFFVGPHDTNPAASVRRVIFRSTSSATEDSKYLIQTQSVAVGVTFPILILSPQDGIRLESTADNLGTVLVTLNVEFWLGLRGVLPPGMA